MVSLSLFDAFFSFFLLKIPPFLDFKKYRCDPDCEPPRLVNIEAGSWERGFFFFKKKKKEKRREGRVKRKKKRKKRREKLKGDKSNRSRTGVTKTPRKALRELIKGKIRMCLQPFLSGLWFPNLGRFLKVESFQVWSMSNKQFLI